MYTAVLMLAMVSGTETIDHGRRGGCSGCYGGGGYGCSGYYGGGCSGGGYYGGGGCCGGAYGGGMRYSYGNVPGYGSGYAMQQQGEGVRQPCGTIREVCYSWPNETKGAIVRVVVPHPEAKVWFDGAATKSNGTERIFESAPLEKAGTYTIKTSWTENGKTMDRQRNVNV